MDCNLKPQPLKFPESQKDLGEVLLNLTVEAQSKGWSAEAALREAIRIKEAELRDLEAPDGNDQSKSEIPVNS